MPKRAADERRTRRSFAITSQLSAITDATIPATPPTTRAQRGPNAFATAPTMGAPMGVPPMRIAM